MADGKNISENFLTLLDSLQSTNTGNKSSNYLKRNHGRKQDAENENCGGRRSNNLTKKVSGDDKLYEKQNRESSIEDDKQNFKGSRRHNEKRNFKEEENKSYVYRGKFTDRRRGSSCQNFKSERKNEDAYLSVGSKNELSINETSSDKESTPSNNIRKMGYKFLESLLTQELSYVVTKLADPRSGFQELLNDRPIRPDLLILIISVLNKVNKSGIHQLKMEILAKTFNPEFIDEIKKYTALICIEENQERLNSLHVFFKNILSLFETVVNLFPSMMNEKLKSVMVAINMSMKNAKDIQGIHISDTLLEQIKRISDQVNSHIENKTKIDLEKKTIRGKEMLPPNSFRDLQLVPIKDDFMSSKSFLRHNIVKGSYKDVEHYLDIQFRLLREDFIAPLRTGIHEYIESLCAPSLKRKYSSVRIYPKVQFIQSSKSRDVYGFIVAFDCSNKLPRNINWEYNKRFIVGSLLLFSDDNFETFYLATVAQRDVNQLQQGLVFVAFVPETCVPEYLFEPGCYFVMAESEVYYEAYRPVLFALQRMNVNNFPMKQYIVDVNDAAFPPVYIVDKSVYNISGYKVNLLDECNWPTPNELKLNPSQHKALKSTLTNDFVVIQGPPGTGKTFLALKVTEIMLKNNVSNGSPIVVICYTNHALDQFLEGILKYTNNLVRIGSQSKNETLAKYNIEQIRKEKKEARTLNRSVLFRNTLSDKFNLQGKMEWIEKKIAHLNMPNGILGLSALKSVVTPQHYNDLVESELDWLYESLEIQEVESIVNNSQSEDKLTKNQTQTGDVFENVSEFQITEEILEEEMDDEENARRMADLTEDDFFDENFITNENFDKDLSYKLNIDDIYQLIARKYIALETQNYPPGSAERFYFENDTMEHIKEMNRQISFIKMQYSKLKDFKFDPERFEKLQRSKVWELNLNARWEYYLTWIHLYSCQLKQTIQHLTNQYQNTLVKLNELNQLEDLGFVRDAAVIGLTTSGAAKRRVLLENLGNKIVIVEEAAEVLEAHIVTSLTQSVEHVILIGDHKQLKPNPAVFELAKKYNLDVSLFERMLKNGLGCSVLDVQHRMRPEIASLIVPAIYPSLKNHPSTLDRPKIKGIDKFVFFLAHNHHEDQLPDSASRQNKFEGDFLIALCRHLLLQGYRAEEITILATYSGQVWYMRKEKRRLSSLNSEWKNVRITPVDNFQGEENRIILLSLVRSNNEARIGFLSTENRVCVALSRAREGLYIVGNMDNLTASSTIWPKIKQQLQEINAVGHHLILRCDRHPDQLTQVSAAKDFSKIPEGGCSLMCNIQLDCGHVCPRFCHIIDSDHSFYKCVQSCTRPPCDVEGHKCFLRCWEPCQPCAIPIEKMLPCGHSLKIECNVEPATVKCMKLVPVTLPTCGHLVQKPCSVEVEQFHCTDNCTFRLPCGHSCTQRCHVLPDQDPDHIEYKCMKECTRTNVGWRCNHPCAKQCHEQCGDCVVPILTKMSCGHSTKIPCSKDESSVRCEKDCLKELPCGHKCKLKCFIPCDSKYCLIEMEKVGNCGHTFKKIKCNEPIDYRKCTELCSRKLSCGHPCTDRCRNDCAKVMCQVLVKTTIKPACGHPLGEIPCYINNPDIRPESDELVQVCQAPCNDLLPCGHICSGKCKMCMQGRLHMPCNKQCNKLLICGHKCTAECKDICPPCKSKDCFSSCSHQKCTSKHICNTPCEPCTRPCVWQCKHYKCTKQCGEECNRPVCNEPCTYQLKCGHLCIGYCGEQHPSLCRVCDLDNPVISSVYIDDRYVVLEDCDHVINSSQLEQLVRIAIVHDVTRLMKCPNCDKPIVKTMRCRSHYIRFRKNLAVMLQFVCNETIRLRKVHAQHVGVFASSPTNSKLMNSLLLECSQPFKSKTRADVARLFISCLLQPLAIKSNELKLNLDNQRLSLRLDYLANTLRCRLRMISYEEILQIELEIARTLRALTQKDYWYNITKYTWEEDSQLMTTYNLEPITKISSSLRTRDAAKQWFQCAKQHFFVSENAERCVTCEDEEKEKHEQHSYRPSALRRNIPIENQAHEHLRHYPQDTGRRGQGRGQRRGQGRGRNRGRYLNVRYN